MAQHNESTIKQFKCTCQKEHLSKGQIIDHLKIKTTHNIRKIDSQSSKKVKNLILNKIANIAKTQIQIQASSYQLIQAITQNTSAIIQNLSNIIYLYRHLILSPSKAYEIKKFQLINTFKLSPPLYKELTQHFAQQPVAQTSTIDTIAKNVKTQVIDIRRNHVGFMLCMAVFSDEKRVVTGGQDGAIRIWNLETKSQIWFMLKHKDQVRSLALGNAEELVLTGSQDTSVRLWNVKLKLHIHKFEGHMHTVFSVLFSQDQSTGFSGSNDKTVRSWNLKSLEPLRTIYFQFGIWAICLTKQEEIMVACGDNGCVSFFDSKDSKHSNTVSNHNSGIKGFCFTPDEEQFITGSEDGTVEVWLTNGLKNYFSQKKHSASIISIKISTCSKFFATGSDDSTVIIWDLWKLDIINLINNKSSVYSLCFFIKSSFLLICWGFGFDMCSLSTFVKEEKLKINPTISIEISSNLKYAAYGFFCVCIVDIENKTKKEKSSNLKNKVACLKFSPNSAFLAAGCLEGEIVILSIPNLVHCQTLYTKLLRINCLSFSRSNELIGFCDLIKNVKVMCIKKKEVLYFNEVKVVHSVCFYSNDENFFYSDFDFIYVTKNYTLLTKIGFNIGVRVREIFVNENDTYILVSHWSRRWSIIKTESLEKEFEEESRIFVKEWCTRRQESSFRTHLSLFIS